MHQILVFLKLRKFVTLKQHLKLIKDEREDSWESVVDTPGKQVMINLNFVYLVRSTANICHLVAIKLIAHKFFVVFISQYSTGFSCFCLYVILWGKQNKKFILKLLKSTVLGVKCYKKVAIIMS